MPIWTQNYDSKGRHIGYSIAKTGEEIAREEDEKKENALAVFFIVALGLIVFSLYWLINWISNLLSTPHILSFPHNLFAYYFHYFFKIISFVLTELVSPILFGIFYKIPFEYISLVGGWTNYNNFNLFLRLIITVTYVLLMLSTARRLISAIAKNLNIEKIIIFSIFIFFGPAVVWVGISVLELILRWLFR